MSEYSDAVTRLVGTIRTLNLHQPVIEVMPAESDLADVLVKVLDKGVPYIRYVKFPDSAWIHIPMCPVSSVPMYVIALTGPQFISKLGREALLQVDGKTGTYLQMIKCNKFNVLINFKLKSANDVVGKLILTVFHNVVVSTNQSRYAWLS